MTRQFDHADLKPGFIFLPADIQPGDLPDSYIVYRLGTLGFFARLDPTHFCNGWEAVTYQDYQRA